MEMEMNQYPEATKIALQVMAAKAERLEAALNKILAANEEEVHPAIQLKMARIARGALHPAAGIA
jgi:hypothetical protein